MTREVAEIFARVNVEAALHAVDVDTGREYVLGADQPVVLASVVKVLIACEFARQVVAGQLDDRDRVRVRDGDRLGGTGTSGCLDDVDISLRDLAVFMMSLSDNTAADLLLERVGLDNVRSLTAELGLGRTRVTGGPRDNLASIAADLGCGVAELPVVLREVSAERLRRTRAHDPAHSNSSTPRDITSLLSAIWRDQAGPPQASGYVRDLMARQINWHRIASGFPDAVRVAAKSGSLPGLRNEAGVAIYPDGHRYAIAVFTSLDTVNARRADVDAAIGYAAYTAVAALRAHDP